MNKKNLYTILIYIIFVCFVVSCHSPIEQNGLEIDIDLTKTYPEQEFLLQDIAEISYLPLETLDDFLVAGTISYMDTEQIIMKSNNRDRLFFFDRNTGGALRMLNRQGRGGNEYNRISSFSFDRNAEEVFVLDASQKTVLVYNLNQTFKRSFEVPSDCVEMAGYDDTSLLVYIEQDTISKPFLSVSKKDGHVLQILDLVVGKRLNSMKIQIGDMVTEARMRGVSASFVSVENGVLISDWACDTLYCFDYNGVLNPFAIRKPSALDMKPCWRLHLKGDNGRFVFFLSTRLPEMWDGRVIDMEFRRFVYDRQENKIVTPRFVLADDPTGAVWSGKDWGNQFGTYLVCELKAENLYAAYRDKKLQGRLSEIASTLKEDDNPVLMILKFFK